MKNNTIANYKNFNTTYKKAFDDVFATQKYSFVIPKDLRTIPQLRKEVIDPNEYSVISKFIEWLNINSHQSNIDDYFPGFEIN